jgi:hypothetical protein
MFFTLLLVRRVARDLSAEVSSLLPSWERVAKCERERA